MSTDPPSDERMRWPVILTFTACLIGYALLFSCDKHLRENKGPWEITFDAPTNGAPGIIVNQPGLGITNVTIRFEGQQLSMTNPTTVVRYDNPRNQPAFGELRFHDLSYLPGTITLVLFNHEIELIPRGLFINRKEIPWSNAGDILLAPTNSPPPPRSKRMKKE